MTKIVRSLKRIHQATSMIIRAIELCFNEHEIYKISIGYNDEFHISLQAKISNNFYVDSIDINVYDNDAKKCIFDFLDELHEFTLELSTTLEEKENEILSDIEKNGITYEESAIVDLSTVLMFRRVIENLKRTVASISAA